MDAGLIGAILLLALWAVGTVLWEPAGWFHGLLSIGVTLLIMRIVALGTKKKSG